MILAKEAILKQKFLGTIVIDPYEESLVQENSVDFRLGYDMWQMKGGITRDLYNPDPDDFEKIKANKNGMFLLQTGGFYIGTTFEKIGTVNPTIIKNLTPVDRNYHDTEKGLLGEYLVPEVKAKSTLGRQGLTVALCAGHGEIGYRSQWALEIRNVTNGPVYIAPRTVIGQVIFHTCSPTFVSYGGADRYQDGDITRFLPKGLKVV